MVTRWFKRRFGYARLICLALLVGLAALRIWDPPPVAEVRVRTFDAFQLLDPRKKTVRPVTIVDIDEKSLADPKLGQWPWPRTRIADIVNNLTKLGAVVIGEVGGTTIEIAAGDRSLVAGLETAAGAWRSLDERAETAL